MLSPGPSGPLGSPKMMGLQSLEVGWTVELAWGGGEWLTANLAWVHGAGVWFGTAGPIVSEPTTPPPTGCLLRTTHRAMKGDAVARGLARGTGAPNSLGPG